MGLADDVVYQNNRQDPYLTVHDVPSPPPLSRGSALVVGAAPRRGAEHGAYGHGARAQEDDTEDLDDFTIRPTDALLVAGTAEEDYSHLDVHIYEEPDDNIYVHHDIMLPTYPLSIAWTDFRPGSSSTSSSSSGGRFCPRPSLLFSPLTALPMRAGLL